jgi:hypothetical protein
MKPSFPTKAKFEGKADLSEETPLFKQEKIDKGQIDAFTEKPTDKAKEFTAADGNKIVDSNGDPIIVYHGTNKEITKFKEGVNGIFFSENKKAVSDYAQKKGEGATVYPSHIYMENPFIANEKNLTKYFSEEYGAKGDELKANIEQYYDANPWERDRIDIYARQEGYDGIIIPKDIMGDVLKPTYIKSYVVFNPENVKSVYENTVKETPPKLTKGEVKSKLEIKPPKGTNAVKVEYESGKSSLVTKQDVDTIVEPKGDKIKNVTYGNVEFNKQGGIKPETFKQQPGSKLGSGDISTGKSIDKMIEGKEPVSETEPFKLNDKIKEVLNKFDVPIAEKYLPNKLAGVYKRTGKNIRTQAISDITTVVHEVTHALDERHGIMKPVMKIVGKYSDGKPRYDTATYPTRRDLTKVYKENYPGGKSQHSLEKRMTEGLATFIENYFYNPSKMLKEYPSLVEDFIKPSGKYYNKEITRLLDEMNNLVDNYAKLTPEQRIGSRILDGKEVIKQKDNGFTTAQRIEFEAFNPFEPLDRLAQKTGVKLTEHDPTTHAYTYLYKDSFVANWVKGNFAPVLRKDGNFEFSDATVSKYKKLVKGNEKEFQEYLVSRRTVESHNRMIELLDEVKPKLDEIELLEGVEKNKAIKELSETPKYQELTDLQRWLKNNDIPLQDANSVVEKYKKQFDAPVKIFDKINNNLLTLMEDNGWITAEHANNLRSREGYASFQRLIDDELLGESVKNFGGGTDRQMKSLKKATGGKQAIIDPTYNQILAINETYRKVLMNNIWKKVFEISRNNPELARRFEEIEGTRIFDKDGHPKGFAEEGDPNIITIRIDGEKHFVKPSPEYAAVAKYSSLLNLVSWAIY